MRKRAALVKPPDQDPIQIGHFCLTSTGMTVTGRPTFAEYERVGDFIKRAHQASGFWLADWLRFGESRQDWQERLSQAHHATGLSEKTLKNLRAIGSIQPSRRRDGIEFALHAEVVALEPEEQSHWLERAETEGWDRSDLRHAIRSEKRKTVLAGRADQHFTVEVTVTVDVEAPNHVKAEETAWDQVKRAVQDLKHAKVITAHTRPT